MAFLLAFALPFCVAWLVTPWARRLSFAWELVAVPGGRRQHTGKIPMLGGIPLFVAYLTGAFFLLWWMPPPFDAPLDALYLRGVLLGTAVVFIGGLIDDKLELSSGWQFVIQGVATAVAMSHDIFIELFTNPLTGRPFAIDSQLLVFVLTLVWIVGIINAVNWLDGVDGLASGVGGIALLLFAWHGYNLGQTTIAAFPLALAGAVFGFLWYNFVPAKIFLGTAGVFVLGYNLATLSILSPAKFSTALLVLAVPILDGVWLVIDRMRRGQNPLKGDRGHLHFRLLDSGWSVRQIVWGYYGVAVLFGLVAVLVPSAWVKFLLLLGLAVAILAVVITLSYRADQEIAS